MSVDASLIAANYHALRARVDEIGGPHVGIVAVTKTFPIEAVMAVHRAGCTRVGENYAQELVGKFSDVPAGSRPEIHFIGQLQSNKVRLLSPYVSVWQSIDRHSLVESLAARVPGARVMIQVGVTGEPGKGGCAPTDVEALVGLAAERGLSVVGLMTVGPTDVDPATTRRVFRETAALAGRLGLSELSMGMSGDWEIAVSEGATLIRVGSAIFGDRPPFVR